MHATRPASARRFVAPLATGLVALSSLGLAGCETTPTASTLGAPSLPITAPGAVGISADRLERLTGAMQELVDEGRLAGMTTMLARSGGVAHFETYGYRDIAAGEPMPPDAIFRIYSMSKPITGVALMMLYEEGAFRLSDPVARYIPEFRDVQVAAGVGPSGPLVEAPDHPITIRELMTHTAGLTYGIFSESQVDSMYVANGILDRDAPLGETVARLAEIPLRQQPGTQWHYSVAVDVQGYLVEVLSGQPFDEFLQERLFGPLGMVDTGFHVPPEKADRFAQVYQYAEDGSLVAGEGFGEEGESVWLEPPILKAGGHGLVSTTSDYMRFCQMLLNGGELDGVRILSPTTVDLMSSNHLPDAIGEFAPGLGFGLDFAIVTDPVDAESFSAGVYYWGGAAGTWFWIDPVEDLAFVGMIQQFGQGRPDVRSLSTQLVYQAITESLDMAPVGSR